MNRPEPGRGFRWDDGPAGAILRCGPLAEVARHAFTSRQLELPGVNGTGWAKAAALVACATDAVHRARQVHGATVLVVDDAVAFEEPPPADALVTVTPGAAVAVVTADCVPILLADPVTGAVGAVHAGWRGTAADVAGAAVRAMDTEWAVPAGRLVAAIGPSIGACCYDVGEELFEAFAAAGHEPAARDRWFTRDADGRLRLDLWAANRDLLVRAGLSADRIHVAGLCTKTHLDWFESYRAAGPRAGRMAAIIRSPEPRLAARD